MEAFLNGLLPRVLMAGKTFTVHVHQGKKDLLRKLPSRLRGYAKWLPEWARIVILVDLDNDDCDDLKQQMERAAQQANLLTRTTSGEAPWQVVNRIAIEELEAWFFSEWTGVRTAYPKVSEGIPRKAAYRLPDAIAGGTWEALERVFRNAGYFSGGLRKLELASTIGRHLSPVQATSPSFRAFHSALVEAVS